MCAFGPAVGKNRRLGLLSHLASPLLMLCIGLMCSVVVLQCKSLLSLLSLSLPAANLNEVEKG